MMRGAGDQYSVGERMAFYRRRRGITQRVLADLVGRSEDWVSKVERGERELRRLDVLTAAAAALRVSVGDLLGQPVLFEDERDPAGHDVPAVRDALMSPRRLSKRLFDSVAEASPAPGSRQISRLTEGVWAAYQRGQIGQVVRELPHLIRSAQSLEQRASRDGWAVSARVHHLAASTLSKIGEADLAWLAAERSMYAADQSDDALVLASAARAGTHALLASGRYDDAMELGLTAASWLQEEVVEETPASLSLLGMIYLRAGIAAARHNDRAAATSLLDQAEGAADRLGVDANYWQTSFGPTNVLLHRISAALDLGDVAYVVETGPEVDVSGLPRERAVSHQIDVARAQGLIAADEDALQLLLSAEESAPQLVRHSPVVRETVRAIHRRTPATRASAPVTGLAERCRAI